MSNRVPRRQGVIYGPPRPEPEGANSALFGRVLGIGMVALAIAVLAGAFVLVNRPPGPSPTRLVGPTPSPGQQSPSPPPSALPTSSLPTLAPTPIATPFVPVVQIGPGFVTFGTEFDAEGNIADPRALFVPSDRIAWSGYLTEPTETADLTVRLYKLDDSVVGGERLLSEGEARTRVGDRLHYTRSDVNPNRALDGPGIYLVRYLRTDIVLAEGYFELGG